MQGFAGLVTIFKYKSHIITSLKFEFQYLTRYESLEMAAKISLKTRSSSDLAPNAELQFPNKRQNILHFRIGKFYSETAKFTLDIIQNRRLQIE